MRFLMPFVRVLMSKFALIPASLSDDVSLDEMEPKRSLDIDDCSLSAVGALVIIYGCQRCSAYYGDCQLTVIRLNCRNCFTYVDSQYVHCRSSIIDGTYVG
jgi:hypothetical protein